MFIVHNRDGLFAIFLFLHAVTDKQRKKPTLEVESRLMFTFVHSFSSQDHGHECRRRNEMGKQKINKLAKIKYKI